MDYTHIIGHYIGDNTTVELADNSKLKICQYLLPLYEGASGEPTDIIKLDKDAILNLKEFLDRNLESKQGETK